MKALIIGGGIAGPVTAAALARAGIGSEIFERYPTGADGVGAWLTLAVNGMTALRAAGVDPTGLPGIDTPRMAMHLGSGRKLTEFPNGPALADGSVSRSILRADLYAALRGEAARLGVPTHHGKRLVDVRSTRSRVVAVFEDGTEAEGDILIGADGLRSRTRTLIDPDAPPARYTGLLNTGGCVSDVDVPGEPGTLHLVFGRRCFFAYLPAGDGRVWWFANPGRRAEPDPAELAAIGPDEWRAYLLDLVAKDRTPATTLIRATGEIFAPWPTYDFPTVPRWHRDRMVIIGDAAHAASPASGQGASMAAEDAVTLARCLSGESGPAAAFAAYEAMRRERVERIVALGKRNGDQKAPGPVGRVVRDLVLRLVFSRPPKVAEDQRWVYEYEPAPVS
jgi:2-polyprenyl-6-methoxyphenol hydroxylase-like FAD-dependent oxidoreductase